MTVLITYFLISSRCINFTVLIFIQATGQNECLLMHVQNISNFERGQYIVYLRGILISLFLDNCQIIRKVTLNNDECCYDLLIPIFVMTQTYRVLRNTKKFWCSSKKKLL